MALIICPECGKEVSDKAENCIHCGYPLKAHLGIKKTANKTNYIKYIIAIGILMLVCIVIAFGFKAIDKIKETNNNSLVFKSAEKNFTTLENIVVTKGIITDYDFLSNNPNTEYCLDIYAECDDDSLENVYADITSHYSNFCDECKFDYEKEYTLGKIVLNNEYNLTVSTSSILNEISIYDNDCNGDYTKCKYTNGKPFSDDYNDVEFYDNTCIIYEIGHQIYAKPLVSDNSDEMISENHNFDGADQELNHEKKLEIITYINGILDPLAETNMTFEELEKKADEVWADAEEKYNITETDIFNMMADSDLTSEYYSNLANETKVEITNYDATLNSNGYGHIAVAESKDVLSQYIDAISNNDDTTIGNLLINGQLAVVEEDVKVNVDDFGIATCKITILEGMYEGFSGYVISEQVSKK